MYYENGSFKIYYEKYGNSKNIILILPGWGDTKNTFNFLINNLSINNTIYIIDNPGFGKSIVKEENLTIYDYASTIRELINHEKISNPTIIAHSFGGRIATLLSGYYNDKINKLILIDIAGIKPKKTLKNIIKKYTYKLLKKITKLSPLKYKRKINTYLLKKFSSTDYYNLPDNMRKTFQNIVNTDLKFTLTNIKQSTLILWGQNDTSTSLKDAYVYRKKIKNSALIVFRKATHYSYLDYPLLTLDIINNFIKEKSMN